MNLELVHCLFATLYEFLDLVPMAHWKGGELRKTCLASTPFGRGEWSVNESERNRAKQ